MKECERHVFICAKYTFCTFLFLQNSFLDSHEHLTEKECYQSFQMLFNWQILFLSYQGEKQFLGMKTGGFYKGFHFSVHFNKIFCGRKFS